MFMVFIHPLVISTVDFLTHIAQWVFQTLPQSLMLSPLGPQSPIHYFDSYFTDKDLLYQVQSPSTSFFSHSIIIYLSTFSLPSLSYRKMCPSLSSNPFSFHPATLVLALNNSSSFLQHLQSLSTFWLLYLQTRSGFTYPGKIFFI